MKTALIFPGIGYHTDKPLLYYGKKLAGECGFQIVEVCYKGFAPGIKGDAEKMREAFESALAQTEELLGKESFNEGTCVCFSKSIGTAVAAAYQKRHGSAWENLYFTPVEETFSFAAPESGIVFHGTADPWVQTHTVRAACERLHLPLYITEGANHSLETGDCLRDLDNLQRVMRTCREFLHDEASRK